VVLNDMRARGPLSGSFRVCVRRPYQAGVAIDTMRVAERSQQVLRFARREAQRLGAPSVTPDHLLPGLLNDGASGRGGLHETGVS
jgi:hypothetical protein